MTSSYRNLYDLVVRATARWGSRIAFRHIQSGTVREIVYGQLPRLIRGCAGHLADSGVGPGAHVVICAENSPEWVISAFACWHLGAVVVPVDARSRLADAGPAFAAVKPLLTLAGPTQFGRLCGQVDGQLVVLNEFIAGAGGEEHPPVSRCPEDPALIVFTSGSSGQPKGVVLSHGNIAANVLAVAGRFDVAPGDRLLSVLPLSHMFEFTAGLLGPLRQGATIVYTKIRGPEHLKETLKVERISAMLGVPMLYQKVLSGIEGEIDRLSSSARSQVAQARKAILAAGPLGPTLGRRVFANIHRELGGHIKFWAAGGAPVPGELSRNFASLGIPLLSGYGLSEAAPIVSANTRHDNRHGSVGRPVPGVEVRIDSRNTGTPGEILVRGPSVMQGYFQDSDATEAALAGGWLHTGDLGWVDQDGYLYVSGRTKTLIVTSGGLNIHPEEIERALEASGQVKEAAVLGRSAGGGEQPFAIIVTSRDRGTPDIKSMQAEVTRCLENLAEHKRLAGFVLSPEDLPRTAAGKLRRGLLPALYESLISDEAASRQTRVEWDEDGELVCGVLAGICDPVVLAQLGQGRFRPGARLAADLGIDSFSRLALACALEEATGLPFSDQSVSDVQTVDELVCMVKYQRSCAAPAGSPIPAPLAAIPERASTGRWPEAAFAAVSAVAGNGAIAALRSRGIALTRALLATFDQFQVEGAEHLCLNPPFIVIANHTSHMDTAALLASFPPDLLPLVHPVAALDTFFATRTTGFLSAGVLNAIPFDRFGDSQRSLDDCLNVLKTGGILIVFPEGTRSTTGRLSDFKPGAARLSIASGCPVVPAYIDGAYRIWPKGQRLPRAGKLKVSFGPAIYPPPGADLRACQELTTRLQAAVEALSV